MSRLFLVVAALVALAIPASASAATPDTGAFRGDDGVSFHVRLSPHGTPTIDLARFDHHAGFAPAFVHDDGTFHTCARVRINSVLFREYCINGHFGAAERASGTVKVFHGAHGHVAAHPSDTHHWTAALG